LVTLIGGFIAFVRWIKKDSEDGSDRSSTLPLWDTTIEQVDPSGNIITIARLAVTAANSREAADRTRYLMVQWNQIKLGFELPLDQPLPDDDEGKPIWVAHPEYLPQEDGQAVELTVDVAQR